MLRQLVRRIGLGLGIVFFVVTATFLLVHLAPGDPVRLWVAPGAGAEEIENARRALGLDRPLSVRYVSWLADFVRGNWGVSLVQQRSAARVILDALPHTLLLSATSLLLTYLGGILVGAVAGLVDPDILENEGPFAAIDDLLGEGTIEAVVSYHVAEGRRSSKSVLPRNGERKINTLLEGASFMVNSGGAITAVGSSASIAPADVSASNGIIHVIDTVLLPIDLGL